MRCGNGPAPNRPAWALRWRESEPGNPNRPEAGRYRQLRRPHYRPATPKRGQMRLNSAARPLWKRNDRPRGRSWPNKIGATVGTLNRPRPSRRTFRRSCNRRIRISFALPVSYGKPLNEPVASDPSSAGLRIRLGRGGGGRSDRAWPSSSSSRSAGRHRPRGPACSHASGQAPTAGGR
jgi:hypothetical protein